MRGMAYPSRSDLKWFFGLLAVGIYGGAALLILLGVAGIGDEPAIIRVPIITALVSGSMAAICGGVGSLLKHKKAGAIVGAVIGMAVVTFFLIVGAPHW
jgi:hypothetical protein